MVGIITADTIQVNSILTKTGAPQTSSNLGLSGGIGKNILINGAMQVAQRGTSVTGLGPTNDVFGAVDRVKFFSAGSHSGQFTAAQVAITDLPGFANAMKLSCTTADTSIAAAEHMGFKHMVEGQDLQQIKKGTASAQKTTLSFYVKANAAATYTVELRDIDNNRINTHKFDVTTSWTRVVLPVIADTTGAYDNDNAMSLQISWWLHAGSDFTSGTFAENTWATRDNTNRVYSSNTSFLDSTARTLFITGIQYEVGEAASEFEHKKYSDTLKDCLRYFYRLRKTNAYGEFVTIRTYSSDDGTGVLNFPQPMRVQPTLTIDKTVNSTNFAYSLNSISIAASDVNVTQCGIAAASSSASAFVTGGGAVIQSNGASGAIDVSFDFSSEL